MGGRKNRPGDPASPRQLDCLRWISGYVAENEWAPSVREIAAALGFISTHAAHCHLTALEAKGLLFRAADLGSRKLRITEAGRAELSGAARP